MPEIKNQFTGGKMNKDLDERLIPKGQYRDAMNVQVSTSDDSNVGAVENLLGNKAIDLPIVKQTFILHENGFKDQIYNCVGSIADEKDDTSYWFLAADTHSYQEVWDNAYELNENTGVYTEKPLHDFIIRDYIVARTFNETSKTYQENVVFTDRKKFYSRTIVGSDAFGNNAFEGGLKKIYIPYNEITRLSVGDNLTAVLKYHAAGVQVALNNCKIVYINAAGYGGENYILLDKALNLLPFGFPILFNRIYVLEFSSGCLQFDSNNLITSINIVDDLLFWTDGINEPKVINIPRSAEGTDQNGIDPTMLINPFVSGVSRYVLPHDIRVIKRKPTKKLTVEYSKNIRSGVTKATTTYNFNSSYNLFSAGYTGTLTVSSITGQGDELNYEVGDILLLLNSVDVESGNRTLPYEYDVKLVIEDITFNTITNTHDIQYKIISISTLTPSSLADFSIVLDETGFEKFENEMVRFSYRYRYLDKEVSAFAPFTDLIFEATEFHYTKDTAYNMGMRNIITDVKLKDFIDIENTLSIESVDLLVKFENSPLVYIIDTIKRSEFPITSNPLTSPFDGEYDFNPKNIKGVVPENQMLRPWDAVPINAKSQEVIGNRIVYGNYTSSYDFDTSDFKLNVFNNIRPLYEETTPLFGVPSIKSKRHYQVGIVLLDENGRESPVFSNNESSVEIPKTNSADSNSFLIENHCAMPVWAKSYKYYIKDTSLPFYNIVVDAFYKAENGDFWISAPSSERNKIQEGDFLELKKGVDSDVYIPTTMSTKAIAIKNEAPEFIATTWRSLGKANAEYTDVASGNTFELFEYANFIPQVGARSIKISKETWMRQYHDDIDADTNVHTGKGGGNSLEREGINDMSIIFSTKKDPLNDNLLIKKSKHYSCGRIALEKDDGIGNHYHITLDDSIRPEDDWLTTSSTEINSNVEIEIFEKIKLPRPRFQGKFFVKIEAKENLQNFIAPIVSENNIRETKLHETPIFNFAEHLGGNPELGSITNVNDSTINNDVDGNPTGFNSVTTTMNTYDEWEAVFKFRATNNNDPIASYWFVDRLQYYRQSKEAVWTNDRIRIESMPDNSWVGSSGSNVYPYISGWSKRYGLGVFISNPLHLIAFPEVDAQEPDGSRVPYYAYHDPIGSESEFYPGTTSVGSPSGFIESEGKFYMELSLIGLFEQMPLTIQQTTISGNLLGGTTTPELWSVDRDATRQGGWPYWDTTINLNSDNQKTLDYLKTENQKFKFEGGIEIFTIKSCHLEWRYNYADGQDALQYLKWKEMGLPACPPGVTNYCYNQEIINQFIDPLNRRLTAIIEIDKDPLAYTDNSGTTINITDSTQANAYTALKIIFLETSIETLGENKGLSTSNPAVFETEREEEEKLDIYYEASEEIPIQLNPSTLSRFIPVGSKITYLKNEALLQGVTVKNYEAKSSGANSTCIVMENCPYGPTPQSFFDQMILDGDQLGFTTISGNTIYLKVLAADVNSFVRRVWVSPTTIGNDCSVSLSWYNCFSFGNGVESMYLKDSFNKPFITKGVKASSTLQGDYKTEIKTNGLIYSGLYNENSETNNLNQFIMAEKITKEINPTYGSIQKLHASSSADGDLIALCEDRVLKILANKDAVYNADGNPQLTATENVLGQAIPYSGNYGISKNPESFASESYRCYFTDKIRGVVLRLSKDGLTPISDHGMKDWFRDHLKLSKRLIGSYDSHKKEYNITLNQHPELVAGSEGLGTTKFTVSFKEDVKGWVSFKSFAYMHNGLSCANDYYTYHNNHIWLHHSEDVDANTFYNVFRPSTVNVVLNDNPGVIKTFHTLNYEGSQGRYDEAASYNTYKPGTSVVNGTYASTNYQDMYTKFGWYAVDLQTDKEKGQIRSFVEKEGKWFNYIHGVTGAVSADGVVTSTGYMGSILEIGDVSWQGIGSIQDTPIIQDLFGCTCNAATFPNGCVNYDPNATHDDGSCVAIVDGCMDLNAVNYNCVYGNTTYPCNDGVNNDDGSCLYPGCTDETALNYDKGANVDDGSCIAVVLGCTNPLAINYNPNANTDDGSCISVVLGCTDATALNYDPDANTDDGNCVAIVYGCTNLTSLNYDPNANVDDGSCYIYDCNDNTAINYNPTANNNDSCVYCDHPENLQASHSFSVILNQPQPQVQATIDPSSSSDLYISWDAPINNTPVYDYKISYAPVDIEGNIGTYVDINSTLGQTNYTINGLNYNATYIVTVTSLCWDGHGSPTPADMVSGDWNFGESQFERVRYDIPDLIIGCTTPGTLNYDPNANYDHGCIAIVYGCTDPDALNYHVHANTDDGSCLVPINPGVPLGCNDPTVGFSPDILGNNNPRVLQPTQMQGTEDNPGQDTNFIFGSCTTPCTSDGTKDGNPWGYHALNYDPTTPANVGISSTNCLYPQDGDTDYDGIVTAFDHIMILQNIGNDVIMGTRGDTTKGSPINIGMEGPDGYVGSSDLTDTLINLDPSNWVSNDPNSGMYDPQRYQALQQHAAAISPIYATQNPYIHGLILEEIDNSAIATFGNHKSYRLYAQFIGNNSNNGSSNIFTLWADPDNQAQIVASDNFWVASVFNQFGNGTQDSQPYAPGVFGTYPENAFSSWLTIGDDYDETIAHTPFSTAYSMGDPAVFNGNNLGNTWNANYSTNISPSVGIAIFKYPFVSNNSPSAATGIYPDANNRILLGQFTIYNDGSINTIKLNMGGTYVDDNGQTVNYKHRETTFTTVLLSDTGGCMDSSAVNYNASATVDNGTCQYSGCTNSNATNYNPNANINDGSCTIFGCTDSLASNHSVIATVDDGSCVYIGCMDSTAANYNPNATTDDGSCNYGGCMDNQSSNYDPNANFDDGSC